MNNLFDRRTPTDDTDISEQDRTKQVQPENMPGDDDAARKRRSAEKDSSDQDG